MRQVTKASVEEILNELAEELRRRDIIKIRLIMTSMGRATSEGPFLSLTTETQGPLALSFLVDILKRREVSSSYNSETMELNVTVCCGDKRYELS